MKNFWSFFREIVGLLSSIGILLAVFFDHANYITDRQLMFLIYTVLYIEITKILKIIK